MMAKATMLTAHMVRTIAISRPMMKRAMLASPLVFRAGSGRAPRRASAAGTGCLLLGEVPLERVVGRRGGEQVGLEHRLRHVAEVVLGDVVGVRGQAHAD